jgi:hypothetical protein
MTFEFAYDMPKHSLIDMMRRKISYVVIYVLSVCVWMGTLPHAYTQTLQSNSPVCAGSELRITATGINRPQSQYILQDGQGGLWTATSGIFGFPKVNSSFANTYTLSIEEADSLIDVSFGGDFVLAIRQNGTLIA